MFLRRNSIAAELGTHVGKFRGPADVVNAIEAGGCQAKTGRKAEADEGQLSFETTRPDGSWEGWVPILEYRFGFGLAL